MQLKFVNSSTGTGKMLRNALWHSGNTIDQVTLLWKDPKYVGWKERTEYAFLLLHRPEIGLIRFRIYEGNNIVVDSGNIFDHSLKGGKFGVFSFLQEKVIFFDLAHRCNSEFLCRVEI